MRSRTLCRTVTCSENEQCSRQTDLYALVDEMELSFEVCLTEETRKPGNLYDASNKKAVGLHWIRSDKTYCSLNVCANY